MKTKKIARMDNDLHMNLIAHGEDLVTENYPVLHNISSAFLFRFIFVPKDRVSPEYVYVKWENGITDNTDAKYKVSISQWNIAWEAGQIRHDMFENDLPEKLKWITNYRDSNIYLLPEGSFHRYNSYSPLFHLLPAKVLREYQLPLLKQGNWPFIADGGILEDILPRDFNERLAYAFAKHIWPFINSQSGIQAFSNSDSVKILAHNLDFWIPYIQSVAEKRLRTLERVNFENEEEVSDYKNALKTLPPEFDIAKPRKGGYIWSGEEEALEATKEMVEYADANGKLRGIIDAIRSNRVEDDFSDLWSYAKEDFERKIYHKRNKIKVSFVELTDTIPVHGPDSEIHENLLWEDFMALLDPKEKQITVLLRNGITRVGEISNKMGYANHSPISKALKRIRKKALTYLG